MKHELEEAGKLIIERLKGTFQTKGLNDTKEAVNSLSYRVEENKLLIDGLARVLFLEFGREKGKFPPVDVIRSWVERKLGITEEKKRDAVAFMIGRKIAREGTDILTDRSKGLQIELTLDEVNNIIFNDIATNQALSITNGLMSTWESDKQKYR